MTPQTKIVLRLQQRFKDYSIVREEYRNSMSYIWSDTLYLFKDGNKALMHYTKIVNSLSPDLFRKISSISTNHSILWAQSEFVFNDLQDVSMFYKGKQS